MTVGPVKVTRFAGLAPEAIVVLARAEAFRSPVSDLVFPGQDPRRILSDMTLLKILRDANAGVTVHGFRSSFRDWAAEKSDFPGEVAEAAQAHTIPNKVEAACRRTDYLEKRKVLMADWARHCTSLLPDVPRQSNQPIGERPAALVREPMEG